MGITAHHLKLFFLHDPFNLRPNNGYYISCNTRRRTGTYDSIESTEANDADKAPYDKNTLLVKRDYREED